MPESADLEKFPPPERTERKVAPYTNRAAEVYFYWQSGYTEEEIAQFLKLEIPQVEKDLRTVLMTLHPRVIGASYNDHNRLLVCRNESEQYRRLLGESLKLEAKQYLNAGMSPASVLKEFREVTNLIPDKPAVNVQQNTFFGSGKQQPATPSHGIASAEDLIRKVIEGLGEDQTLSAVFEPDEEPPADTPDIEEEILKDDGADES